MVTKRKQPHQRKQLLTRCDRCIKLHSKCDGGQPQCGSCTRSGKNCTYSRDRRRKAGASTNGANSHPDSSNGRADTPTSVASGAITRETTPDRWAAEEEFRDQDGDIRMLPTTEDQEEDDQEYAPSGHSQFAPTPPPGPQVRHSSRVPKPKKNSPIPTTTAPARARKQRTPGPAANNLKKSTAGRQYLEFDPTERIEQLAAAAAQQLEAAESDISLFEDDTLQLQRPPEEETTGEAMLAARLASQSRTSDFHPVVFDDITPLAASLSPEARVIFEELAAEVLAATQFPEDGVDADDGHAKRQELRELVVRVRKTQREVGGVEPLLVLGLGKLVEVVRALHDFYDCLGAVNMSVSRLRTLVGKPLS